MSNKIYKITNSETKWVYIGQTRLTLEERFQRHVRDARASFEGRRRDFSYFHRMLMYYGPDKFKIELLEDNIDADQLDIQEAYWIQLYNSYECGYNSTLGGQNIALMQEQIKNKWQILKGNNPLIPTTMQSKSGASIGITCYSTTGEKVQSFCSAAEASRILNITAATIRRAYTLGGNTVAHGMRWRRTSDNIESLPPLKQLPNRAAKTIPDTQKPVLQFTKDGTFIQEWETPKQAADTLNINVRCIIYNCNHKQKSAGNFIWQFKT